MDPKKVKAILEWPTPRSATEVRSFHGLASFYKKFIKGFSGICGPLTEKNSGGLARHFGWDKTFSLVAEHYYLPQL